ncbi:MAG: isopentenyl phosphate kinase [Candidatus Altiarchaeota archaeon]
METVVLKLGGSVITKKSQDKLEINKKNLGRLSSEIASALNEKRTRLVIVHGAGPFGHVPAKKHKLKGGLKSKRQVIGFSITHQSMEKLNQDVVETLQKNGVNAISFQPSAGGILEDGKLVQFPVNTIRMMLQIGMVPVSYGDVLIDIKRGVGILSGDQLAPYIAKKLKAKRMVIATDVDGIYDRDPKNGGGMHIPLITKKNISRIKLSGSKATDVTGGMEGKVREIMSSETEAKIISALKRGNVRDALLGKKVKGTVIRC